MRVSELKAYRVMAQELAVSGSQTVAGNQAVTGNLAVTGAAAVTGAVTVTGAATLNGGTTLSAVAASGVTHLLKDAAGKTLLATGATLPADAGTVYAKGCLFIDTDVATGTSGLYVNIGTSAACVFKLVSNAA